MKSPTLKFVLFVLILALAALACGSSETEPTEAPAPTEVLEPTEVLAPTDEPTKVPEPTKEPTDEPSEIPEPTETPEPTKEPAPTEALHYGNTEWWVGGTLHSATIAEWNAATNTNKIATAADWVTSVREWEDEDQLLALTGQLAICADDFALDETTPATTKMNEIAALCAVSLGW